MTYLIPHLEINVNGAWRDLTSHADLCALAGASVQWGTSEVGRQPDPSVMTFTLRDLRGELAANPTWLTGRGVRLWFGPGHTVVFNGLIAAGLTVKPLRDGWQIQCTATSLMVLWKRLRDEGPTSDLSNNIKGLLHWNVTPADRVAEMNRRATAIGAPTIVDDMPFGISSRNCIMPQLKGEYPSQLTLLHDSFMDYSLPLWYEHPDDNSLRALRVGAGALVCLDARATACVYVMSEGKAYKPLDAAYARSAREFQLLPPYTGVTVKFKTMRTEGRRNQNDTVEFTASVSDVEVNVKSDTLPQEIRDNVKNLVVDSDLLYGHSASAPIDYTTWSPFTADETALKTLIDNIATRLTPSGITLDADDMPESLQPKYMQPRPLAAIMFADTKLPFDAIGPYAMIGGTLSIDARHERIHVRHDITLTPISTPLSATTTWAQIPSAWTAAYLTAEATIGHLCRTTSFLTTNAQ